MKKKIQEKKTTFFTTQSIGNGYHTYLSTVRLHPIKMFEFSLNKQKSREIQLNENSNVSQESKHT